MKLYQKVLLTLSGAGMLSGCCDAKSNNGNLSELYRVNAVIMSSDNHAHAYYCDTNGDGMTDKYVMVSAANHERYSMLRNHLCVGDTIKYYTDNPDKRYENLHQDRCCYDSINNKPIYQLLYEQEQQRRVQHQR